MRGGNWPGAKYLVPILFFGAAAYAFAFRLDVIGIGGVIWLSGAIASFVIRTPHFKRSQDLSNEVDQKDGPERLLLSAMFLTMLVLPTIYLATGFPAALDYKLSGVALWVGGVLQLGYLYLFWRSHADLGTNWSPSLEIRQEHTLVVDGIYQRIRHPMYSAIWLGVLAQPMLIQNWLAGLAVLPAFAAMYFIRVPIEERMMRRRFGKEYKNYCLRTGRLVPPVRITKEVS